MNRMQRFVSTRGGAVFIIFMLFLPSFAWGGGGMEASPDGEPAIRAEAAHEHEGGKLFCVKSSGVCPLPTGETADESHLKAWKEMDDPNKDGWVTEEFHDQAKKQLKKLGKLIAHPDALQPGSTADLIAPGFNSEPLTPATMKKVFEDRRLVVERGVIDEKRLSGETPGPLKGAEGMIETIKELGSPFADAVGARHKIKLFRIRKEGDSVVSRQYFAISGLVKEGYLEENATWVIRWRWEEGETPPRIEWMGVEAFERVMARGVEAPLFSDVTEAALGNNASYKDQLQRGLNHWLGAMENLQEYALLGAPGIAVGDVNGDGLEDLYLGQAHGLPNRLFIQDPDGTARDASEASGVDWLESTRGVLLVDLDNDGDQDLAAATLGNLVLSSNDGRGRFAIRAVVPVSDDTMSISAADYDNDGDLDIYVTGYNQDRRLEKARRPAMAAAAGSFVYHDANNGAPNIMLRNDITGDGHWRFTDVTGAAGLDANNTRFSFAASWEDYDNDGDQDLYVANDYGRDNLYRNDRSPGGEVRFTDVADEARVESQAGGMSVTWGDYNRDGWMDVFVSNMWSSAGNRVTFQNNFKKDGPADVKTRLRAFARGNTLLKNLGSGRFEDVSAPAGIEVGRWAWGSDFADLNNDGWEDLVVANGYMTGDEKGGDL